MKIDLFGVTYKTVPEIKHNSCDGCVFLYGICSVRNNIAGINNQCQTNKSIFELDDSVESVPTDLVERLRKRAEIRRNIPTRKSVIEGQPDRISDLLEEAATEIERLNKNLL